MKRIKSFCLRNGQANINKLSVPNLDRSVKPLIPFFKIKGLSQHTNGVLLQFNLSSLSQPHPLVSRTKRLLLQRINEIFFFVYPRLILLHLYRPSNIDKNTNTENISKVDHTVCCSFHNTVKKGQI